MKKALFCLLAGCSLAAADEDSFRERFADPATRMAALAELTPGSSEAYFHTALAHQLAGREAEFRKTIDAWKGNNKDDEDPFRDMTGLEVLETRQLLMDYAKNPQASLKDLIERLELDFDDTRPDAEAESSSLPTRVDPALIQEAAFEDAARAVDGQHPYTQFRGRRLYRELEQIDRFDERKLRWFYDSIHQSDHPGVVPLVSRMIQLEDRPLNFLQQPLLRQLTAGQLDALLKLQPSLRDNGSFNQLYLNRLRPSAETNLDLDLKARAAYVQRCLDYALALPPTQNEIKAVLLHHHLELQRELGQFPKKEFMAYLALPRREHPLLERTEQAGSHWISGDEDLSSAIGLPKPRPDVPLIESYLLHFLAQADSSAEFVPYVEQRRLFELQATAQLLAGGSTEEWGKRLDPDVFKQLLEETRILFAPGAPVCLDADSAVTLTLDLKNTPDLLVRIYELDLPSFLQRQGHDREPDADIDVDGLVPHHERRLTFAQPPMTQHRESVALPELAGPGVWLVDMVSGQVSARALVRKGQLSTFIERQVDHQEIAIFDEKGKPVPGAKLTLGNENFESDANGRMRIPDAANNPARSGLLKAGKLAKNLYLEPRQEVIALDAAFHLDREQLLADQEARLQLRVQLTSHGHALPLERIKDPTLVLKAELLGGVTTERVIAEGLKLTPTMEVPFQVPSDLLALSFTLRGTVTPTTGGDEIKLEQSTRYELNLDLQTPRIATAFFSPTADGHRLELRGRNGEPLASRVLNLEFTRADYRQQVDIELRTDAQGRIELGTLDGIESVIASGNGFEASKYVVPTPRIEVADTIQVAARDEIIVPMVMPGGIDRSEISLIETSDRTAWFRDLPLRDHFDKLQLRDGQLVIRQLPPGNYVLRQGSQRTTILVSSGQASQGLLVSRSRILPVQDPHQATIASTSTEKEQLKIQLRGAGPDTRVSVIGRRYQHLSWQAGEALSPFPAPLAGNLQRGYESCGYLTERRLSDEMRYILDRRNARVFPGNLLPRPSLLLNRWTESEVSQEEYDENNERRGKGIGMSVPSSMRKRKGSKEQNSAYSDLSPVCDFLGMPAAVKFDLQADAKGALTLPLDTFIGCQYLEVIAAGPQASERRIVALAANDTPLRDRRIARPLDAKSHHLATRSAAVLAKGATASIANLLDADWRAFTTMADAHQLLYGMQPDERLREFIFLTEWPTFTEAKKLELLSQHACHELHLFLARKDKPFFDKHVKPMLKQKPAPTFIDDLLLGRDLKGYLKPYAWQRLNAAEKALLGQALPQAHDRIARELAMRWQLEAPGPDAETMLFTQTLRGTDLALQDSLGLARNEMRHEASPGVAYITEKMRRIIIPRIDFENTTVEEAIDFLRQRAAECDTLELDPAKKGINLVARRGQGSARIAELKLRNVPLEVALKYICDAAKLRYKADDYAITIVPQTETGEDLFTRVFTVPPDFAHRFDNAKKGHGEESKGDDSGASHRSRANSDIKELLKHQGVYFPEGSSVILSGNKLLVSNTPSELEKVDVLTQTYSADKLGGGRLASGGGFSFRGVDMDSPGGGGLADMAESDPFADPPELPNMGGGGFAPMLPVFPDCTRLWRESNYCEHVGATDEELIPLNRFWVDLAAWDGKGGFLSPHFNACTSTGNEALMCLALLDLPFKAERPEVTVDGSMLRVKAREPMILFYKDIRSTEKVAAESSLLVRQSFCPLETKFRIVDGHEVENPVTGDFRPGVPYCASLIVTNPTGTGRRIDLLAQIPAGSIPLDGQPATLSATVELEPHGVLIRELAFYFPAAGEFAAYPLHLSEDGTVLNHTPARSLRVSNDPEKPDADSWETIAREGSNEAVLKRLQSENLDTIDLDEILWRLKDKGFFESVMKVLGERLYFDPELAAYGFHHNDVLAMRAYLENSGAIHQLGEWLDSTLIDIRPRIHRNWETLEFDPLVNPRAHRFGNNPRLSHPEALDHYRAFLDQLAWKPQLDAADQLTLCAFLFLQDRIDEALDRFGKIDPAGLPGRIHYDYLHAVALFYQEKPTEAKAIAVAALPTVPPGIWRERFQAVIDQADEIKQIATDDKEEAPAPASVSPHLEIHSVGNGKLALDHRGLEKATLRFFSVDLEMLFSKNPFLKNGGGDSHPAIQPNATLEVAFAKDATRTEIELPAGLHQGNVLVAAESAATRLVEVLDSTALELRHQGQDRTVQVLDAATRKPMVKTYVKVYVETHDGKVRFHKDGYTDLRGKFDYLSHSGEDPAQVRRVAILASDPQKGARTMIYNR